MGADISINEGERKAEGKGEEKKGEVKAEVAVEEKKEVKAEVPGEEPVLVPGRSAAVLPRPAPTTPRPAPVSINAQGLVDALERVERKRYELMCAAVAPAKVTPPS